MFRSIVFATIWVVLLGPAAGGQAPASPDMAHAATAPPVEEPPGTSTIEQANALLASGDYAKAMGVLKALEAKTPHDPDILYDLGLTSEALHAGTGADPQAEADYRAAIAANPLRPLPHVALGLMLARSGRVPEAHEELATATRIPDIPVAAKAQALRALARLDLNAGNNAAASDELAQALSLSPETPDDTLLTAEIAQAVPDLAAAEGAYRRYLVGGSQDPNATAALAHVLVAEKRPADAEAALDAALEVHPGDPVLTSQLAATLLATNDPAKVAQAAPLLETLHRAKPEDANIARLLGRVYLETGHPDQAEAIYGQLVAAEGAAPDASLLADRAEALMRLNRPAEAEALLKRAVADRGAFPNQQDFGDAAMQLAFAAAEIDDPRTVLQALELRGSVLPSSLAALFLEATARDQLHQSSQAAELYTKFLAESHGTLPEQERQAKQRLAVLKSRK